MTVTPTASSVSARVRSSVAGRNDLTAPAEWHAFRISNTGHSTSVSASRRSSPDSDFPFKSFETSASRVSR